MKINNIVKRVIKNYPYLAVTKIMNHRKKCSICDSPNSSVIIRKNNRSRDSRGNDIYVLDDKYSEKVIVNLHNFIESQGDIDVFKAKERGTSLFFIKHLMNFLKELEEEVEKELNKRK